MRLKYFKREKKKRDVSYSLAREEDVKILIEEDEPPLNRYYLGISRIYNLAEYIFIVIAVLFAITSVAANPEIISYKNFLMLVNDINTSSFDYNEYSSLLYSSETPEKSVTFGGGTAVVGKESVFVYTDTGRLSYAKEHGMKDAMSVGDGKYLLLYDFGKTEFKLYNIYTEVFSGKNEYPIYSASVGNDGSFCFVEETAGGKTRVSLYSSAFDYVGHVEVSGFALLASPGENGSLAVVSIMSEAGSERTKLVIYDAATGAKQREETFLGEYPLALSLKNRMTTLLLSESLVIISEDGTRKVIPHNALLDYHMGDGAVLIAEESRIVLFSEGGDELMNREINLNVKDVSFSDGAVFVLSEGRISRYLTDGDPDVKLVKKDYAKIIANGKSHITAFTKSGADLIDY